MDVPDCDYIISNPPYSMKSEIILRLFDIGKPFAMLVNFQGMFDHKKRFRCFKEHSEDVGMLWLYPRITFLDSLGESMNNAMFQGGYICYKILDNQLEFEYINK